MPWYGYDDYDDYNDEDDEPDTLPDAIHIEGPLRATSRRGPIGETWWGRHWVETLEQWGDSRLTRGKTYARNGSVLSLTVQAGEAFAKVRGSRAVPYQTSVAIRILAESEWQQVLDRLSTQALFAAKLLAGDMPEGIDAAFLSLGLSLFPQSRRDIEFYCTCPDWGDPCKHAAAVYYLLAEQLDRDPFLLMHLKGLPRPRMLSELRKRRGSPSPEEDQAFNDDLSAFWGQEPTPVFHQAPRTPAHPPPLAERDSLPKGIDADLRRLYAEVSAWALTELTMLQTEREP